ncbi:hypothetical protein DUI87_05208 [Hirundo rustica rustica]|uniref:Pseudouridine synthase RsuA/RluA-like domain-containing protein n=1 Tax=Hirundo rustica rustica TaxID=333673 RepID=A0A3M0KWK9_HIRRU|nr:hypothetical protein DUI87_05208 [Hirundo rustica rustica]
MEPGTIDNLSILYQSSDFIVVNKHWDLRIDSKMWYETLTLQSQLKHRFPELADPDTYYGFRFCHQLDFSTSGALCVALNKAAAGSAYKCFKERLVTKAYLALVRGHVRQSRMTIRYAIGKNTTEGMTHMMCIEGTEGCENAKPCQSELVVLEHGSYGGDPVTKVLLQPLTGQQSLQDDAPRLLPAHSHRQGADRGVRAPDPFVTAMDGNWVPQHVTQRLEDVIQELKDEGTRKEKEEERREAAGEEEAGSEGRREETEEQRARCEQWLAEWALE